MDPVNACGQTTGQCHVQHHGLDQHLRQLNIHVLHDFDQGIHIRVASHENHGIRALVGQYLDIVLAQFTHLALAGFAGQCGSRGHSRLSQTGGVGSQILGASARICAGDPRRHACPPTRGGFGLVILYIANQVVQHFGDILGVGIFELVHLDIHIRRGRNVKHLNDAVEENHVLGQGHEKQLVAAFVREDLNLAPDHAAFRLIHERFDDRVVDGRQRGGRRTHHAGNGKRHRRSDSDSRRAGTGGLGGRFAGGRLL